MSYVDKLSEQISAWRNVSTHPHRFGGVEFLVGSAEVGHIHGNGVVDIPFPRSIHDALLADGLAVEHRWVPDSGWVTFRIRSEQDLSHALWLMRVSYLRYSLKEASDARTVLEKESEELGLTTLYRSLLESFIPVSAKQTIRQDLTA